MNVIVALVLNTKVKLRLFTDDMVILAHTEVQLTKAIVAFKSTFPMGKFIKDDE